MAGKGGFTLIETLLALSLAGLVVVSAHRLFAGVTDATRRLEQKRHQFDREANARRWLAEALGSLDVGTDGGFSGRPHDVEFGSWLLNARGWPSHERLALEIVDNRLIARVARGGTIVLIDSIVGVDFDYLLEPGAQVTWVREWFSPVSAPLAVRVRIAGQARTDTLLLAVGPRG